MKLRKCKSVGDPSQSWRVMDELDLVTDSRIRSMIRDNKYYQETKLLDNLEKVTTNAIKNYQG